MFLFQVLLHSYHVISLCVGTGYLYGVGVLQTVPVHLRRHESEGRGNSGSDVEGHMGLPDSCPAPHASTLMGWGGDRSLSLGTRPVDAVRINGMWCNTFMPSVEDYAIEGCNICIRISDVV